MKVDRNTVAINGRALFDFKYLSFAINKMINWVITERLFNVWFKGREWAKGQMYLKDVSNEEIGMQIVSIYQ